MKSFAFLQRTSKVLCTFGAACFVTAAASSAAQAQHTEDSLMAFFSGATVISGPDMVDCVLSEGTSSTCFKITIQSKPTTYRPGPWCPTSISDSADKGGIWLEDGKVYDVDGPFIANLSTFYKDDKWQLFDPATGKINVTDTRESCDGAARPNVAEEYQNHCVVCELSYVDGDGHLTYTIPVQPVAASKTNTSTAAGYGIANNGVRIDAPAPVDAIKSAYTIAAFDDCGGHVNLVVGYHYHAVTDCLEGEVHSHNGEPHTAHVGIAMDGYPIHLRDETKADQLDQCGGHEGEGLGYHYHVGEAGGNAILNCMKGQSGCSSTNADAECDASKVRRRPPPPQGGVLGFLGGLFGGANKG